MKKFTHISIISLLTCLALGSSLVCARKSSRMRRSSARATTAEQTQPTRATPTTTPDSRPIYPGSQEPQNHAPTHAPAHHAPAQAQSNAHDIIEPTSVDMEKRGNIQPHEVKAILNVDDAAAQEIAQCMNSCRQVLAAPMQETPEAIAQKGQEITDAMNKSRDTIKRHISKGDEAHWEEHKDETWKKLYPSM